MKNGKPETRQLAQDYAEHGDPNGWFEEFYARAGGDISKIYWADLKPAPLLEEWVENHPAPPGKSAVIVGCGLGDDAEMLAQQGYRVLAFDISPSAVNMCRERYPESNVEYRTADLFDYPQEWHHGFDLVYECNTVQILKGSNREASIQAIANLTAPGGTLIVSCRSRNKDEEMDAFPVPLDREEIDSFQRAGLSETSFLAYDDDQTPPVPHFLAVYERPCGEPFG